MKYTVLVIGIAILGVSIWGYLDDKAYEDRCTNPRGSFDCGPRVRLRDRGEQAMNDKFKVSDITELVESKWTWGMVVGAVITLSGVVILKKTLHPKARSNVR